MTKRRALWLVVLLLIVVLLAALVPGSPAYLPTLFGPGGAFGHTYEGHSVSHWVKALKDPDAEVRRKAIFALGAIGPDAKEAVPALAAILHDDPDRECRSGAAMALDKMAPASQAAVQELARALEDDEPLVRMNAARALSKLRADARPAVPALIKALKDEQNDTNLKTFPFTIQETVVLALGRATAGSDEAVQALVEVLEGPGNYRMHAAAAQALGEVGPEARAAVPKLRERVKDKEPMVREMAEEALKKIEGDSQ